MEKYDIQKLRDLPIEGVAERLGLRIDSKHKSLCPFHDDHHASLSYNTRRNTCRCFVCMNRSLGTIDLVMQHLHLGFSQACRWLADEHNVIVDEWKPATQKEDTPHAFDATRYERFFQRPWLSDEARHFLYEERHLDPRVVAWCRITSWRDREGRNWLQTPYYDTQGKLIGLQNRNLQPGALPRFRFPYGSRCSIYNLPILAHLKPGEALWITEGCSDCWAMLSAGNKAIAIPSATLLTPADKALLASLSPRQGTEQPTTPALSFHMYPDNDVPGERLFQQLSDILPNLVRHHLPPGCKDYADFYVKQTPLPYGKE